MFTWKEAVMACFKLLGLRKTTRNLSHYSQSPYYVSNLEFPNYEAGMLTIRLWHSIKRKIIFHRFWYNVCRYFLGNVTLCIFISGGVGWTGVAGYTGQHKSWRGNFPWFCWSWKKVGGSTQAGGKFRILLTDWCILMWCN